MSSQKLLDFVGEIKDELAKIGPEIEGFKDFSKLNISPATAQTVASRIGFLQRRIDAMNSALRAATALDEDGYPEKPQIVVDANQFGDLQDQVSTIEAAFAQVVKPTEATSAKISTGQPVNQ